MAGNEINVCKFLVENIGLINLQHIGLIENISAPGHRGKEKVEIANLEDIYKVSTQDAGKKADIYVNGIGVSVKQIGGSFPFNRLQRANLYDIYNLLGFSDIEQIISKLDQEVYKFHNNKLMRRNRPWEDFFQLNYFKELVEYLMLKGSPNKGLSTSPASLILEAPYDGITINNTSVYTFDEYFNEYLNKFKIAIRRQWIGQASNSEHNRAVSLSKKKGNSPWVFNDVTGNPRTGWRTDFPANERKTVYFLMIEKET